MSERAIELLCLEDENPSLVLDVGCGSGISGDVTFLIFLKKKRFYLTMDING
jgi:methylase of polypeptide subunit release factors